MELRLVHGGTVPLIRQRPTSPVVTKNLLGPRKSGLEAAGWLAPDRPRWLNAPMNRATLALAAFALTTALAPRAAHADKDAFDAYVADLSAHPDHATAWLGSCAVLLAPSGEVRRPCKLALADLVGATPGVTLAVTRNKVAPLHDSQYSFRDATVEARAGRKVLASFRVIEVSGFGNPDSPSGGWAPIAVHWIRTIKDKDAFALAAAGKLALAPAIADAAQTPTGDDQGASDARSLADDLDQALRGEAGLRATMASWLDDGATLVGTAPGQTLTGKKGGKAMRGWKLDLAQRGGMVRWAGGMLGVAVTHVVGTTTGKTRATFTYPTMVIFTQGLTNAGSLVSGPRLVTFAVAQ
jgi:hypothetical protein